MCFGLPIIVWNLKIKFYMQIILVKRVFIRTNLTFRRIRHEYVRMNTHPGFWYALPTTPQLTNTGDTRKNLWKLEIIQNFNISDPFRYFFTVFDIK